jgi:hypothetical protein
MQMAPKNFHDQTNQGICYGIRRQSLVDTNGVVPPRYRDGAGCG